MRIPIGGNPQISNLFAQGASRALGAPQAYQQGYTRTMMALQNAMRARAAAGLDTAKTGDIQRVDTGIQALNDPTAQAAVDKYTGIPGAGGMVAKLLAASKAGDPASTAALTRIMQQVGMNAGAQRNLAAGNYGAGNADLAASSGKPFAPTKIEGNVPVNQFTGAMAAPTPMGQAQIGEAGARVAQALAGAYKNRAQGTVYTKKAAGTLPTSAPRAGTDLSSTLLGGIKALSTKAQVGPDGKVAINTMTSLPVMAFDPTAFADNIKAMHAFMVNNPTVHDPATILNGTRQYAHAASQVPPQAVQAFRANVKNPAFAKQFEAKYGVPVSPGYAKQFEAKYGVPVSMFVGG